MVHVCKGIIVGLENFMDDNKAMWAQRYYTDYHLRLMFQQHRFYQNTKPVLFWDLLHLAPGMETEAPLQASDPRDFTFALLDMSADADALGITPDYTKSVRQVHEEVAIAPVQSEWVILLLTLVVDLEAVRRQE